MSIVPWDSSRPPQNTLNPELDKRTGGDEHGFYIRTFTGKQFFWNTVETNEFCIEDIAHALSMNCRWTGHTKEFYSVAQHCVLASWYVAAPHSLAALLHDAAEAYIHDTPSPLKWYLKDKGFTAFSDLEKRVDRAIFKAFGLEYPRDPAVKMVDMRLLATEHRDLMPRDKERTYMDPPYAEKITPWSWHSAERLFLERFHELKGGPYGIPHDRR
jgi:hypothetical protein